MKGLSKLTCPVCKSNTGYAFQLERANIFDDKIYETMLSQFGNGALLSGSTDNITYHCKCRTCGNTFRVMAEVDVSIKRTTSYTTEELCVTRQELETLAKNHKDVIVKEYKYNTTTINN